MESNIIKFESIEIRFINKVRNILADIEDSSRELLEIYNSLVILIDNYIAKLPKYYNDFIKILLYLPSTDYGTQLHQFAIKEAYDFCDLFSNPVTVDTFIKWIKKDKYMLDTYFIFDEDIQLETIDYLIKNPPTLTNSSTLNRIELDNRFLIWDGIIRMYNATKTVYLKVIEKVDLTSIKLEEFYGNIILYLDLSDDFISFKDQEEIYLALIEKLRRYKIYENINVDFSSKQKLFTMILKNCISSKKILYSLINFIYPSAIDYFFIMQSLIKEYAHDKNTLAIIINRLELDLEEDYYNEPLLRNLLLLANNT